MQAAAHYSSRKSVQWSAYPALLLAACLAAGIVAADQWRAVPAGAWMASGAVIMLSAGWALARRPRRLVTLTPLGWTCALAAGVFMLGGARQASTLRLPAHHIAHRTVEHVQEQPLRYVTLEGSVREATRLEGGGARLTLEGRRMAPAGRDTLEVAGRVHVAFVRSPWKPEAPPFPQLRVGDQVRLTGQLEAPPRRRNPADFDYGAYLRRQGIYASFVVTRARDVERLRGAEDPSPIGAVLRQTTEGARDYVGRQLSRFVPSEEAQGVLRALLLGDRSRIAAPTRERFARTGLLHVLAVSGLHVLLVGMVFYQLVRPTLMRLGLGWANTERVRAALTMGLLVAYALLTGAAPSVVRAVVMAAVFIGGAVAQRRAHALNALGVAALVLLAAQPAQLFGAGFQLSFAAVGAIVVLVPLMKRAVPERVEEGWLRQPADLVAGSVAATLGTLPVLLWHFGYVSFAGLALNLIAIPCTALTLGSGLLAVLLGGWLAPVAGPFGAAADVCGRALLWTAEAGDAFLGWATLHAQLETLWPVAALAAGLVAGAQWTRPRLRWWWAAVALLLAGAGAWQSVARGGGAQLEALFLDVGQGDATLLSLPGGSHVLVDAGPRTPHSDHGARTILKHLRRFGIRRLGAVVVTHADGDHLGGLPSLLREVPVGRVIYNGREVASALYAEAAHVLDSLGVEQQAVQAGDTLQFDPQVRTYVISPGRDLDEGASDNDASVALVVGYGSTRLLLTGDAEAEAERRMVRRFGALLSSDLVKVGHHGSSTSSTPAFVRRAAPADSASTANAVVAAGRHNPFGLPDSAVVRRWREAGAQVSVTAMEGAVWFRSDGKRYTRVQWR